ncbi:MAG TPA: N-acetylmuramoyl-L-alanine amidase [bacterium]|nr:N-acetylmuramoyl-L-alanine amidase [bacterium]
MLSRKPQIASLRWATAVVLSLALLAAISTPYRRHQQAVWAQALVLAPKVVVLDPGHGGLDSGAAGSSGVTEKEITLPICLSLKQFLRLSGIKVVLTRSRDRALAETYQEDLRLRAELVNRVKPALLLSIHGNSFPSAREFGAQTFFYDNHQDSERLARCLQAELQQLSGIGENRREIQTGDFYLLRNSPVPAALVEVGFLSNPEEERLLADPSYQKQLAWHLFCGLVSFWHHEDPPAQFLTPVGQRATIEMRW